VPSCAVERGGYGDPRYAASLAEFGVPLALPACGGRLLERPIPGTARRDAIGPYPLFACPSWDALPEDLEALEGRLVTVGLVPDPLTAPPRRALEAAFPDRVAPYKDHLVRDLDAPHQLPAHHRRRVRRAVRSVSVEIVADARRYVREWSELYGGLVARHGLTGIRAFSAHAFREQLALPGLAAVRAERDGATVAMTLWMVDPPYAYYHLGASSAAGYAVAASYAAFASAFEELRSRDVRWVDLGGAAGLGGGQDGLLRFKAGWANERRTAYFCGRILDRRAYAALVSRTGTTGSGWFPAYRAAVGDLPGHTRRKPETPA
jgi:hypothetical protein